MVAERLNLISMVERTRGNDKNPCGLEGYGRVLLEPDYQATSIPCRKLAGIACECELGLAMWKA